jgi:hypothetical protein
VLHLGGALLVSAIMTAPWLSIFGPAVAMTTCGLAGLGYCAIVSHRARRQTGYKPVLEDWLWHAILPGSSYALIALAAVFLHTVTRPAFFAIGARYACAVVRRNPQRMGYRDLHGCHRFSQ